MTIGRGRTRKRAGQDRPTLDLNAKDATSSFVPPLFKENDQDRAREEATNEGGKGHADAADAAVLVRYLEVEHEDLHAEPTA